MKLGTDQHLTPEEIFKQIVRHSNPDLEPEDTLQNFVDFLKQQKQLALENPTISNPNIPNELSPIPPLIEHVTRTHISTEEASYYLNRQPQTLRAWACFEDGLIRPIRINRRLAWPVAEIKRILNLPA